MFIRQEKLFIIHSSSSLQSLFKDRLACFPHGEILMDHNLYKGIKKNASKFLENMVPISIVESTLDL